MPRARKVAYLAKTTLWYGKHELTHLLMGIFWIAFLTRYNSETIGKYLPLALVGSLFPDVEHVYFHLITNRKHPYSRQVRQLLRRKQLTTLVKFLDENHKVQSYLPLHNIFVVLIIITATLVAFINGRDGTMVFLGAVAIHYIFDIIDDVLFLGKLNPNWTRGWGKIKKMM